MYHLAMLLTFTVNTDVIVPLVVRLSVSKIGPHNVHIVTAMLQIDFCGEGKNKTLEVGLYANISFNSVLTNNHFQSQTIHLLVVITCFLCYCSPISKETQVNKRHCDAKRRKASVWTRQQLVGFLSGEVCPAQEQFTLLIDTDASSKRKRNDGGRN